MSRAPCGRRCATRDIPVRSQVRQLSGAGRKVGRASRRLHWALDRTFTGTVRKSLKAIVLQVYRDFFNSETGTAEAGKAQVLGLDGLERPQGTLGLFIS